MLASLPVLFLLLAAQFKPPAISAQTAATVKLPAYDVVSIKPNKTGSGSVSISINDGNYDASNVSLKMLVLGAYQLKDNQLEGLPKWADSDRFDIKAKVVDPDPAVMKALTGDQNEMMLRPVLAERFGLTFHREKKTLPVYEMVIAKDGPKFKEMPAEEQTSGRLTNGVRAGGMSIHNSEMTAVGVPLSSLVAMLSRQLQRIVIDKTGLAGKYDLQLKWTPDDAKPTPDSGADAAPPDIFTALQEQLGLKLQPGKAEVEMFIVDHAEMPSVD
jgi:uncharacterized protein (TIGR03435 family)